MRRFAGNQENNTMKMYRAPLALLLGTFMTVGCWQKLDENASSGIIQVNVDTAGGIGAKFPVETTTPEIGKTALDNGDNASTATDGCDKDQFDTQAMIKTDCEGCHQVGANGNLQGIDDIMSLINKPASSKFAGWKFIVPGDPANSLIFKRVTALEMPPPSSDVQNQLPHPSISDMSVLQQWIMCLGNAPTTQADGGSH
jgi:hypothetical protein